MQSATVTKDVPGLGVQGISLATSTEFDMTVQMPAGMTQSTAARKRAVAYKLKKRMEIARKL